MIFRKKGAKSYYQIFLNVMNIVNIYYCTYAMDAGLYKLQNWGNLMPPLPLFLVFGI